MIKCISDQKLVNRQDWTGFVHNHPNGNAFQCPQFFDAINNTAIHLPISSFAYKNNVLKGVLIGIIQKEHRGILGTISSRCIVVGGPLIENNDIKIAEMLLAFFSALVKNKCIYCQFRNIFEIKHYNQFFYKEGFIYEEHLDIIINLEKNEDTLWNEVYSKRRNEIKKATKEGVYFEIISGEEAIDVTYEILLEIYGKVKLPLPRKDYFQKVYKVLSPDIFKIFVAKIQNEVIGTMYTLCYKNTVYDWYAGSYKKYYNKYPNDLLTWEIFKWAKASGFKYFDFGGAGKPNIPYGVRDYKKKFGGDFVNYGRFERINKPVLMQIAKIGLKLWQKLKN